MILFFFHNPVYIAALIQLTEAESFTTGPEPEDSGAYVKLPSVCGQIL